MNKKKIHIKIITNGVIDEYNLLGELEEDTVRYRESNKLQSILTFDLKKHILTKENIDYKIVLKFKDKIITTNEIYLKKEDKILNLDIKTLELNNEENKVYIKYEIAASKEIVEYSLEIGE